MLPSERILLAVIESEQRCIGEIRNKTACEAMNDRNERMINGIVAYLDEQYQIDHPRCFCKEPHCNKNEHTYKIEEK